MEVTVKLAELWPPGTVTLEGTVAALGLLEESDTRVPPCGATALKETVPVAFVPPITEVGEMVNDATDGVVVSVSVPATLSLVIEAVTCTPKVPVTVCVVAVKFAEVAPAATVTELGTVTFPLLLLSDTESPPVGAAPARVTVPVLLLPPTTGFGLNVTLEIPTTTSNIADTYPLPVLYRTS
jgi:hypothetical protein